MSRAAPWDWDNDPLTVKIAAFVLACLSKEVVQLWRKRSGRDTV